MSHHPSECLTGGQSVSICRDRQVYISSGDRHIIFESCCSAVATSMSSWWYLAHSHTRWSLPLFKGLCFTFPHGLFQPACTVKFMSQLLKALSCWALATDAHPPTPNPHRLDRLGSALIHTVCCHMPRALEGEEALNKIMTVFHFYSKGEKPWEKKNGFFIIFIWFIKLSVLFDSPGIFSESNRNYITASKTRLKISEQNKTFSGVTMWSGKIMKINSL